MSDTPDKRKKPQKVAAEKRRQLTADERRREYLRLWLIEKLSYEEIGKKFNCSKQNVGVQINIAIEQVAKEFRTAIAVDVREEFEEQLRYAKKLRTMSEEYLSDPDDPLRLNIMPRADEIEVIYYDHCDLIAGDDRRPKKKKADLQQLLAMLAGPSDIEDAWAKDQAREKVIDIADPAELFEATWKAAKDYFVRERQSIDRSAEKVTIKHVDMRKFALDVINTTDTCIDKFAKLGGDYARDKQAPGDPLAMARKVIEDAVARGMEKAEAIRRASERYGVLEEELIGA